MARHLHHERHPERGISLVVVAMGMTAFMAATMLTVDVGMLMTSRGQAQNAADAGALAGAIGLAFDDYTDHSASGPAVTGAIAAAKANAVMRQQVSVDPSDVEFLNDSNGQPNRVRVTVRRTAERGNPLSTFIASYLGRPTVDIGATATAEASPANAMTCVKPFIIPDKWTEAQTPPWDSNDTYDAFDNKGEPLTQPDIYVDANDTVNYTGYNQETNRGQRLLLRAGTGSNIMASFYFSLAIGGNTGGNAGGDAYRWNIANCNTSIMHIGERVTQEPGNMKGPTIDGTQELYDRDPAAYWDDATASVKGSTFTGQSPRVFPIPLFDPVVYDSGKRNGRDADLVVANWIGFFLESRPSSSGDIWGRIIPIAGIVDSTWDVPGGAFPKAIRLVE